MSKRDPIGVIYVVEGISSLEDDCWSPYWHLHFTLRDARGDVATRKRSCCTQFRYRIVRYRRGNVVR